GGVIEWLAALAAVAAGLTFIYKVTRNRGALLLDTIHRIRAEARPRRSIYVALAVWVFPYLIFLCFFEPQDPYLRLFYAPALALAVGLVSSGHSEFGRLTREMKRYATKGTMVYAVAALAFGNLAFFIAPHRHVKSNEIVAAAREARKVWNATTVIYFENHNEADTTFEYFNEPTLWRKAAPLPRDLLEREIESAYSRGESVWINRGLALSLDPEWLKWHTRGEPIRVDAAYAPAYYLQLGPPQLSND